MGNKTRVTKRKNTYADGSGTEQYVTTVPKSVAEYLDLEGKVLEWKESDDSGKIEVVIHDE